MSALTAPIWLDPRARSAGTGQPLLDAEEILDDLEAGRSRPLFRPTEMPVLPVVPLPQRARLGGPRFLATWITARVLGRIHPRLARRALWTLWFTPWVGTSNDVELPDAAISLDRFVAGRQVRGFVLGTGPTVFAIHGWGGSSRDMLPIAEDLAASGHRVVVPDLPAHGASPGRTATLFEIAPALAELFQVEGPTAAVVAHSMGFPSTVMASELLADAGLPRPRRIAAIAPARRMTTALDRFAQRARLRPAVAAELRTMIEEAFGDDIWERLDAGRRLAELDPAGIIVHDEADREIPHTEASELAEAWGVDLVSTAGLGHRRILTDEGVRALVHRAAAH